MKIRRFVARDMKTALVQIKEELGPDAVIMSNKKIPEGVEIMAAVDYAQSVGSDQSSSQINNVKESEQEQQVASHNSERSMEDDKLTLGSVPQTETTITSNENISNITNSVESNSAPDSLSAILNRKIQQPSENVSQEVSHSYTENDDVDIEQQFRDFTSRLEGSKVMPASQTTLSSASHMGDSELHTRKPEYSSESNVNSSHNNLSNNFAHQELPRSETVTDSTSTEIQRMKKEMESIRQLLEHQVSGLMWQDMAQKDPSKALLVNRLMELGINETVSEQIAGFTPSHLNEQDAWQHALKLMSQQLNTTNNDIIHRGGVVALVGPTGVGKTTTVAKLAARFAQIHGADQVAMISTDSYRIAGFEQLVTYGRIIGCQVKLAQDHQTLDALLQQFAKKKLVLIDTAGMGQRDLRLAEHLTTLIANSRVKIRNYLVLAANTQQRVMQENVERFKRVPLAGSIYTKLDESVSVGEIIATSIKNGLPIGYLTDGQRVPEDIKVANAEKLVNLADKMSMKLNDSPVPSWQQVPAASEGIASHY